MSLLTPTVDSATIQIPKPFVFESGTLRVAEAQSVSEQIGRLRVLTDRYNEVEYLNDVPRYRTNQSPVDVLSSNHPDLFTAEMPENVRADFNESGLLVEFNDGNVFYLDKYEWQSAKFVVTSLLDGSYVGSSRLILRNGLYGLPTLHSKEITIDEDKRADVETAQAEFSQFARTKSAGHFVVPMLLRAAVQYSLRQGITTWAGTTDANVFRLLNGFAFHFNLPSVGPEVHYLGSVSKPILIDIEEALANAEKHEASGMIAAFIRGRVDTLTK